MSLTRYRLRVSSCLAGLMVALLTTSAHAAGGGGGLPWEERFSQVADSLTGPVAQAGAVIAIVALGGTLALGLGSGALRGVISLLFGLSIMAAAVSFGLPFFGFGLTL